MSFVFAPAPQAALPIRGSSKLFPVRRVYCVGRNYNEHVKEMGGVVGRDPPFFFSKPADALATDGRFPYPPASADVHHEIELVVALGPDATPFGYAVGLDMTRRDLQAEAKKLGRPWDTAKGFDDSGPVSALALASEIGHPRAGAITLDVNGVRRQTGDLAEMIWSVDEIIAALGGLFTLLPGDVIFTGTPEGVGMARKPPRFLAPGDVIVSTIEGIGSITTRLVAGS